MTRGEIYRTKEPLRERGDKPGYYVVVSRSFIGANDKIATVICAPVYGEILGLDTEMVIGPEDGVPRTSAVRCDFLILMWKRHLSRFVGKLSEAKLAALNAALRRALELDG